MKCNSSILTVFIVSFCIAVALTGCGQKVDFAEEAPSVKGTPEQIVVPKEGESPASANEPAAEISFEKVECNFGEVSPNSEHLCELKFTNSGDDTLKITRVSKTCGCTPFTLEKKEYVPGESGTLKVNYHPGKRPGRQSKHLYLFSNARKDPKVKLTIRSRVVPKVDFQPKTMKLLLKGKDANCPEIRLTSIDGEPFAITRFTSTGNSITADFDPSVKQVEFVLRPKIKLENLKNNPNGRIDIILTHSQFKKATITFEALPEFKVTPRTLVLLAAEEQKPITRKVWVFNNYDGDFEIASTSSEKGITKVLSKKKVLNNQGEGSRYELTLEVTPPARDGEIKVFSDVFFINIKDSERLKITCRGFYSKKEQTDEKKELSEEPNPVGDVK